MKSSMPHIKYKIQHQGDGSYVILQKNTLNKKVDIQSHHDTLQEAQDALDDLYTKPSQSETMKFFNDLKNSMHQK